MVAKDRSALSIGLPDVATFCLVTGIQPPWPPAGGWLDPRPLAHFFQLYVVSSLWLPQTVVMLKARSELEDPSLWVAQVSQVTDQLGQHLIHVTEAIEALRMVGRH